MNKQDILTFFETHAEAFKIATLNKLKEHFKIYQQSDTYENETFAETLDEAFFSMGCDYLDYTIQLFNDYFELIIDETELDELREKFDDLDTDYYNLENFIFETYVLPIINEIITKGE
jgi:hypothetical protein